MGIIDKLNAFATKESKLDKKPLFFLELGTVIVLLAFGIFLSRHYAKPQPNENTATEIVTTEAVVTETVEAE